MKLNVRGLFFLIVIFLAFVLIFSCNSKKQKHKKTDPSIDTADYILQRPIALNEVKAIEAKFNSVLCDSNVIHSLPYHLFDFEKHVLIYKRTIEENLPFYVLYIPNEKMDSLSSAVYIWCTPEDSDAVRNATGKIKKRHDDFIGMIERNKLFGRADYESDNLKLDTSQNLIGYKDEKWGKVAGRKFAIDTHLDASVNDWDSYLTVEISF